MGGAIPPDPGTMYLLLALIPLTLVAILLYLVKTENKIGPIHVIGACIGIICVSGILSPIVFDSDVEIINYELPSTIYYDDYIEVSDSTTASGSIEIIQSNGTTYAHAKDVGIGKIGNCKYTVEPAPLDVFLFIGQSNAANWAGSNNLYADPIPARGSSYYFGTPAHQANQNLGVDISDYNMLSMTTGSGDSRVGGIDGPFAAEYYTLTGHKSYIINGAIGGTSITTWTPGSTSYEYAAELFDAAWNAIDLTHFVPCIASYVWIQGEADYRMESETYANYFLTMHETLINGDFTTAGNFEYALISVTRYENPTTAQEDLAATYDSIKIASRLAETFSIDAGTLMSDGVHYTQTGRNMLGVAIAEYYANL